MKRDIFKLLLVVLSVAAVLAGCNDERNNYMVDDTVGFVMSDPYVGVSLLNEEYQLAIIKSGKGSQDATARLIVSEVALAEYNETNGTDYVLLPAECYNLSATSIGFSKDDTRKIVEITWKDTDIFALGDDKNYAIPLQLYDEHDFPQVDQNRNTLILNPKWSNISMAEVVADALSPSASREMKTYTKGIVIDNPIKVMDITVNYTIDNSLIDAYNSANGTSYLPAPEGLVELAAQSSTITAGEASTTFDLELHSTSLFEGNILKAADYNEYLVPVRITSLSSDALGLEDATSYFTISMNKRLIGPWELLEGEEFSVKFDPANPDHGWYDNFSADKLFDGKMEADTDSWASFLFTDNVYPMTFVVDMGEAKVFTKFIIQDIRFNRYSARNFEIYTTETYDGTTTEWTLVASGKSTSPENWEATVDPFDYPVQKMAAGRYLKFVIVECNKPTVTFQPARLMEVYGAGF